MSGLFSHGIIQNYNSIGNNSDKSAETPLMASINLNWYTRYVRMCCWPRSTEKDHDNFDIAVERYIETLDAEKKKALLKLNTTIKPKFGTKWATASSSDESGHEDDLDPEQLAQIIPDTKSDDEDSVISSVLIVGCAIRNNRRRCFSPDRLRSEPNMSMLLSRKTIQNYFTIGRKTDESDSILVKPQFCNCCKKCLRLCCSYCMPSLETDVDDIDAVMERYIQGLDGEKKATILESNRTIKLKISNKWGTQSTDDECEDDAKDSETGNLPQIVLPETASNEDDELWLSAVWQDDVSQMSEAHSSPMLAARSGAKSATPSPIAPSSRSPQDHRFRPIAPSSRRTTGSVSSQEWRSNDEDIDRLVVPNRSSVSSLGLRSDSMASVYSGAFGGECTVAVKGQVEFGLQYNYKTGALEILIKQCRDLAAVDAKRNRSDPYVKVYLLPDKSKSGKRKTKVKKHTLNPIFDECLKFHIALNGLETRTLWLTVWHSDMFGRNDFLGEVTMALENKVFDDPTPKWYTLQERTEPFDDMLSFKGDILVGLKFVPPDMTDRHKKGKRSRGTLHVLIKEAKSLTAVKANGTSDPFCKSYLLPDKGRSSKQKTTVMKKTVNPVWNHTFTYDDVTLQELAERCLELTVWDHDRLASNEFLGGVRFSLGTGKHYGKPVDWMDATGKEVSLWKSMLERPSLWVEGCLSLRPTLDQRSTQ
ncbi:C2 domain [Popillia japonica]|uniref:C2 domain n=1 Tax=Popillia japonica TaxID=7064 RepID=A0AAW1HTF7_POPJA